MKKIKIDQELKDKFNKAFGKKTLEITYYNGYIVRFDKCNVESISPHKILISNNEKNLLVMHYADYHENSEIYYIDGEKQPLTIIGLKEYGINYFFKMRKSCYNMFRWCLNE